MAPTEGRVARPERWWGCRRGTPGQTDGRTDRQTDGQTRCDRYYRRVGKKETTQNTAHDVTKTRATSLGFCRYLLSCHVMAAIVHLIEPEM